MEEKNKLFRQKSLEHISSPEQLNDYIRVENRGAWIFLGAVIVLLIGICVWGFFGQIDGVSPVSILFR